MLLYTHLSIAKLLLSKGLIKNSVNLNSPSELSRYYLASILPDIRYLMQIDRKVTHPSLFEFEAAVRFVDQPTFVWGYRIHLIADEIENTFPLRKHIRNHFWFLPNFFLKKISGTVMRLLFELYYMEKIPPDFPLYFEENDFTRRLGIQKGDVEKYQALVQQLLESPDWETITKMLGGNMNIKKYKRLRRYYNSASNFGRSPLFKKLLMLRMRKIVSLFENAVIDFIEKGYHLNG